MQESSTPADLSQSAYEVLKETFGRLNELALGWVMSTVASSRKVGFNPTFTDVGVLMTQASRVLWHYQTEVLGERYEQDRVADSEYLLHGASFKGVAPALGHFYDALCPDRLSENSVPWLSAFSNEPVTSSVCAYEIEASLLAHLVETVEAVLERRSATKDANAEALGVIVRFLLVWMEPYSFSDDGAPAECAGCNKQLTLLNLDTSRGADRCLPCSMEYLRASARTGKEAMVPA